MTHRKHAYLLLVAAATMALAACSKDSGSAAAGSAMGYFPKDATAVFGVSLEKARKSELFDKFKGQLTKGMPRDLRELEEKCGFNLMNDINSINGAFNVEAQSGVVVISGNFTKAKLLECLKSQDENAAAKEDGKFVSYTVGGKEGHILWHDDHTVVVSDKSEKSLDDFKKSVSGGAKDNEKLMGLVKATNANAVLWAAGNIPSEMSGGMAMLGATPSAGYASVDVGSGLDAKVGLRFASGDEAKKAADVANNLLKQAKEGPQGAMLGAYLGAVEISPSDSDMMVKISLDKEKLDGLMGLASMMGM